MPLPQVRSLRHDRGARRDVRARPEHHQREDLRRPLVLVHHPRRPHLPLPDLRHLRHRHPLHEARHGREERQIRRQGKRIFGDAPFPGLRFRLFICSTIESCD